MKLRIAISQRVEKNRSYPETRDALDAQWTPYLRSVLPCMALFPVPNCPEALQDWLEAAGINALILSGGNSLGEYKNRDIVEKDLFNHCLKHGFPVLGVCRGLHVINFLLNGGDPQPSCNPGDHVAVIHRCTITREPFGNLAGGRPVELNSYHRLSVSPHQIAWDLRAFAMAGVDTVEGLYHVQRPVLAMQWHPERSGGDRNFSNQIISRLFHQGAFWNS